MPPRPDTADSETPGPATGLGRRARIALGFAAVTIVTAVPTGVIATVAVVTV